MGILQRFSEIMSANVNALLDKAEDPVKMADQTLRKLEADRLKVKEETAAVMAEETNAKRRMDQLKATVDEYANSAKNALASGNEEDARKLVAKKQEYESQLETAKKTYEVAHTNSENMQAMFKKLSEDIDTLNSRRENVKAQMSMAKAQEKANQIQQKIGSTNAMETFNRMEEKAQRRLDQSSASVQLNGIGGSEAEDLNKKYSSGSSASVDSELERMKRELGMQ